MSKFILLGLLGLALVSQSLGSCGIGEIGGDLSSSKDPDNYHEDCSNAIRNQILMEFRASLQYLLMGSYFSQDTVNLEGYSNFFFNHADEERDHGIKFMEYLRHRGDSADHLFSQIDPILNKTEWKTGGEEALKDALIMEKTVSKSIKNLIDICDNDNTGVNDYHAADWLTGQWLEEQLDGHRKLAGMINELTEMKMHHQQLGDWLYSNQLLK